MIPPLVVAVVGPTAAGKTALAIRLAEALGAEILGCDAQQIREGLPLLTAKPSRAELRRVPHHLIGVTPLQHKTTAFAYVEQAEAVLRKLSAAQQSAILCGGTGLYLRALTRGLFEGPASDQGFRQALRKELDTLGVAALHERLTAVDPVAAAKIERRDYVRIERALEVYHLTGQRISDLQNQAEGQKPRKNILLLGLDPGQEILRHRIRRRVLAMLETGLLDEVAQIEAIFRGELHVPPIGYQAVVEHLHGDLSLDQLIERLENETCKYAKRQRTWFRSEPVLRWFGGESDISALLSSTASLTASLQGMMGSQSS